MRPDPKSTSVVEPDRAAERRQALDLDLHSPADEVRRVEGEVRERGELAGTALASLGAVLAVADLARDRTRPGVVREVARGDPYGVEVVEQERTDRPAHRRADPTALVRLADPGPGLAHAGHQVV